MIRNKILLSIIGILLLSFFSMKSSLAAKNEEQVTKGGSIVLTIDEEPESLNPISATSGYAHEIQSWICDSLLTRNPETYEWEPALAEKWALSNDSKTAYFTLKSNLFFHDDKELTSEDVKFSFDIVKNEKMTNAPIRTYFENIESVDVIDKLNLKINFKNNYFKNFDIVAGHFIIPKHIYNLPEKNKDLNYQLTCSGAYKLQKYEQGLGIDLIKFATHYSEKSLKNKNIFNYSEVKYKFLADENIKIEKLKKNEIDYIEWRNSEIYEKRAIGDPWGKELVKYKVENKIPKVWSYIGWNLENTLFKDKNIRLALSYLANREEINRKFFNNNSLLVSAPISPVSEYAPNIKPILYDPKKALELLTNAGWKDSNKDGVLDKTLDGKLVEFKFTLVFANKEFEKLWTILKEDMRKVGIVMNLKFLEFNSMLKLLDESKFDAMALSWAGGSVDPDPKQVWHSSSATKGSSNFIGYKNLEVDKLIDEARFVSDKKKRIALLQKTYRLIAEDSPYLFMFSDRYSYYATSAKIKKLKPTFNYNVGSNTWWLEK
jgi:microcin C transport system substrate-binding protein